MSVVRGPNPCTLAYSCHPDILDQMWIYLSDGTRSHVCRPLLGARCLSVGIVYIVPRTGLTQTCKRTPGPASPRSQSAQTRACVQMTTRRMWAPVPESVPKHPSLKMARDQRSRSSELSRAVGVLRRQVLPRVVSLPLEVTVRSGTPRDWLDHASAPAAAREPPAVALRRAAGAAC
jgi:hypothetical protein